MRSSDGTGYYINHFIAYRAQTIADHAECFFDRLFVVLAKVNYGFGIRDIIWLIIQDPFPYIQIPAC